MARKVRALVTIVDYNKGSDMQKYYINKKTTFGFSTHGYGTASSEILNYMGLVEDKKSILITILEKSNADYVLWELKKKFKFDEPGKGIAFSIPVSSMNKFFVNMMEEYNDIDITDKDKEKIKNLKKNKSVDDVTLDEAKEDDEMKSMYPYELIFTIVGNEYLEKAKNAAKKAGARGGTSIHAVGLGAPEAFKFLGIVINPEKEIMLNVVKREDKDKVMSAIVNEVGIATAGQGICFSIPVEDALGLSINDDKK